MSDMMMNYQAELNYARQCDERDPLRHFRQRYHIPLFKDGESIYLCGNSLGLEPKAVRAALDAELEQWKTFGVEGHFRGERPWMYYHRLLQAQTAQIVGALESEVVVMNSLTVNLHLLMVSFYRPSGQRFKIIMEAGAFPSDQYAVESQVRWHGFDPENAIVEVDPRPGEYTLRTEDILEAIRRHGPQTALVLFGGVNYYTGQLFDLDAITRAGHEAGAIVGFDLAHAAGNVPLTLHDWGIDFAAWCSYKYLNAGPGGPGGVFIHERHGNDPGLPRFAGWWGHDEKERFLMRKGFRPMAGAAGWQLSNVPVFSFAPHRVSLDLFVEATMPALRKKSEQLTGYLAFLLDQLIQRGAGLTILTPADPRQRGCQLSLYVDAAGKALFDFLSENGVICDWREDNLSSSGGGVIRIAPVPMYNSYEDVFRFAEWVAAFFRLRF